MTDFLEPKDSVVVRPYCPSCEPDTDPTQGLVELRWCPTHTPAWGGTDDLLVTANVLQSGEAGDESNREWCKLVHGDPATGQVGKRRGGR